MTLAFPTLGQVAPGSLITSALWNNDVVNGLTFLSQPPVAILTQTASQSLTSGTPAAIAWDTTTLDTYGGHSNSVNNTRYTAQQSGLYVPVAIGAFAANATGIRYTQASKNGTAQNWLSGPQVANGTFVNATTVHAAISMNIGDYIETLALQSSGGALSTSPAYCELLVYWLHT